ARATATRAAPAAPAAPEPSPVAVAVTERPEAEARGAREPLRELTLGRSPTPLRKAVSPPLSTGAGSKDPEEELPRIEARCRRKAEAARLAARRQRGLASDDGHPDDGKPPHPAIAARPHPSTAPLYWLYAPP